MDAVAVEPVTVLHLGCGKKQTPEALGMAFSGTKGEALDRPVRFVNLDANPYVKPELLCMLGRDPIPLPDDSVDLALAFHVIEHIGEIGKSESWFYFWAELYRVMKPGARVQFECPYHSSVWAWADPTHIRAISEYTFLYLNQDAYRSGGAIPDYRPACDFVMPSEDWSLRVDQNADVAVREPLGSHIRGHLTARKPFRPYWLDPVGTHDKAEGPL